MTWTEEQTLAIARRILAEHEAGREVSAERLEWATEVIAALSPERAGREG